MSSKETKDSSTRPGALGRGMDALMGDGETRNTEEEHRGKEEGEPEKIEADRRNDSPGTSNDESAAPATENHRQADDRDPSGAGDDIDSEEEGGSAIYIYDRSPFDSCPVRLIASGAAGAIVGRGMRPRRRQGRPLHGTERAPLLRCGGKGSSLLCRWPRARETARTRRRRLRRDIRPRSLTNPIRAPGTPLGTGPPRASRARRAFPRSDSARVRR